MRQRATTTVASESHTSEIRAMMISIVTGDRGRAFQARASYVLTRLSDERTARITVCAEDRTTGHANERRPGRLEGRPAARASTSTGPQDIPTRAIAKPDGN